VRNGETYEFLVLATVLYPDVRLAALVDDREGEVLDVGLHFGIRELATDETLGIEHAVKEIITMSIGYDDREKKPTC
jgi:hypothetical protein